jgi:hypothetical protein
LGQGSTFITTDQARDDINEMVKTFEEVHYNPYFKIKKEDFNKKKEQFLSKWTEDSISLKRFIVAGMKLSALMSGGHSALGWQNPKIVPELYQHKFIPFTGKMLDSNRFVVTKSSHNNIKEGTEIVAINGIDIAILYKECMSYVGGIYGFKNYYCESIFPLHLFFNDELKGPYSIKINNSDDVIKTAGIAIGELMTFINSDQVVADYSFEILEDDIGLISYNKCSDYEKFKVFLGTTFEKLKQENINKLIIDIRKNGGGNSSLNDLLLSYITKTPYQQSSGRYWKVSELAKRTFTENEIFKNMFGDEFMNQFMNTKNQEVIEDFNNELFHPIFPENYFEGKSCLLIGPATFSSANFLADAIKTYKITTLIGKPTGEYTNDFGELLEFKLKNSGSIVFVSSAYDIGANGNASVLEPVYPDIEVKNDALKYAISWIKKDF